MHYIYVLLLLVLLLEPVGSEQPGFELYLHLTHELESTTHIGLPIPQN